METVANFRVARHSGTTPELDVLSDEEKTSAPSNSLRLEQSLAGAAVHSRCFPLKRLEPFAAHRSSRPRNVFSLCERDGCRSLRKALASI